MSSKALSASTINENMKKCRYDVRGEIYLAAVKRTEEGKEVIYTNVGNPQALGQVPITFNRQVMALLMAPFMMDDPHVHTMFASDAISRAKLYLSKIKGDISYIISCLWLLICSYNRYLFYFIIYYSQKQSYYHSK